MSQEIEEMFDTWQLSDYLKKHYIYMTYKTLCTYRLRKPELIKFKKLKCGVRYPKKEVDMFIDSQHRELH